MSPALQADALVIAIDHAESRAAAVGRAVTEAAEDLDTVARRLSVTPAFVPVGPVASGSVSASASRSAGSASASTSATSASASASASASVVGGWSGRSGDRARGSISDAATEARMLAGACLFLSDVLRVEGARLARAVMNWSDDDNARHGSGDLVAVTDADSALARRLREAADALAGAGDTDTRPCIDLSASTGDDPRAVATMWHSLGPADRERLARDHPELGSVAGLSSATRDAINRMRLRRLLDGSDVDRPGLATLAAHLDEDPRRHLLSLHADGRAVVASANPDVAGQVVTLVPGTGSSLESMDRTGERADALCATAAAVDLETKACVAVAWQGYDAPDSVPEAGRSTTPARAHAEDLRTFAAGIDAVEVMDGHDAPHSVVGYSYGSTTLGAAAADPQGLAADRMIHVGSPGAVVNSIDEQWLDERGVPRRAQQDEVIGVANRWDPVPWYSITGLLGGRPGTDGFGGLAVDVTEPGSGPESLRSAHSRYFDPGTVSLEEIGRLIADTE